MRIMLKDGEPFAFAGLWESWKDPAGESVLSCTIVTIGPNSLIEPIHNRMPVILSREAEPVWLDQDIQDTALLSELLVPYSGDEMEVYQVSKLVNSPGNNSPELCRGGALSDTAPRWSRSSERRLARCARRIGVRAPKGARYRSCSRSAHTRMPAS